jgi:hypothetical protein
MKTKITNHKGQQFEIETYFLKNKKGYGTWNITCEVWYGGEFKSFVYHTTDSSFIDEINNMGDATWDEIQNAYKEKAFDSLKQSILVWCEEVEETVE